MNNYSYYNMLIDSMQRFDDCVILSDERGDCRYSDLLSGIDTFCDLFEKMGIQPGDHVGLWSYNSANFIKAYFAIVKYGAVAILLNSSLPAIDVAHLMKKTDTEWLLYGNTSSLEKNESNIDTVLSNTSHRLNIDNVTYSDKNNFIPQVLSESESKQLAYMIFTSGSSGTPKGVMLSQYASLCSAYDFVSMFSGIHRTPICIAVPMFHCLGLHIVVSHLISGGKLCLGQKFNSSKLISVIEKNPKINMAAIATIYLKLLEDSQFAPHASNMRLMFTGGGSITGAQISHIESVCQNASVLNGYGQTEAESGISFSNPDDSKHQRRKTVGRPYPSKEVAIMDRFGNILPANKIGEIVVRDSGNIMLGYYNTPDNENTIDETNWLHTGDLGFLDENGYINLSGRIKDIIIKGGENITPSLIENEMTMIDGIADAKIFGAPDEMYGENIHACVTLKKGYSLDSDSIRSSLKGRISSFKMPANIFIFDSFPLHANGKVNYVDLKNKMLSMLNTDITSKEFEDETTLLTLKTSNNQEEISDTRNKINAITQKAGFSNSKQYRIALCVDEIISECFNSTDSDATDLTLEIINKRECMQINFSKNNRLSKFVDELESNSGERIILAIVDRMFVTEKNNCTTISFQFLYENDTSN